SVPSRSKRMPSGMTARVRQIVDPGVAAEGIHAGERVVAHADEFVHLQAGLATVARQLGRFDEAGVFMRAARQQIEDVFSADDGEEIRLRVAVECREKDMTPRLYQP